MPNKKLCFVIMPFAKTKSCSELQWTSIYNNIIKPAVTGSRYGFACERIKPGAGNIIRDILGKLNEADLVIADLTDKNSNVFYELGVRHTLQNRTILISQSLDDVPSDLRSYWVIKYKRGVGGSSVFKAELRDTIRKIIENPEKSDSPIKDFLNKKNISLLSQEKHANSKKLAALLSEILKNKQKLQVIFKCVQDNKQKRKEKKLVSFSTYRLDNSCIKLILSTRYIELPDKYIKNIDAYNDMTMMMNVYLDTWNREGFGTVIEGIFEDVCPLQIELLDDLFKLISELRRDYLNDNYQEPSAPYIFSRYEKAEKQVLSAG